MSFPLYSPSALYLDHYDLPLQNYHRTWPHTGVILNGGKSHGGNLASLPFRENQNLGEAVLLNLREACQKIIIAGTHKGFESDSNLSVIADKNPNLGPLSGIESVLQSGLDQQYIILPCDMPLMFANSLQSLILCESNKLAVFSLQGKKQPFPMKINAILLPQVKECLKNGIRNVQDFVNLYHDCVVDFHERNLEAFKKFDLPPSPYLGFFRYSEANNELLRREN